MSSWLELQQGWRLAVQLLVAATLIVACYLAGGYAGQWAGHLGAKAEVRTLDRQMKKTEAPVIPPNPFTPFTPRS